MPRQHRHVFVDPAAPRHALLGNARARARRGHGATTTEKTRRASAKRRQMPQLLPTSGGASERRFRRRLSQG
jgi:hypothetical protein